uniref:Uncharacterized protein n=1 Tax=Gouania willdenowi TaxID=441366 RepID=A0A8C5DH05_GOUWI
MLFVDYSSNDPYDQPGLEVTNLVPGMQYDLCVLATWEDSATTLTATNIVGCVQFITREDYPQCQSLHSGFLGGTMILVVGGIIVTSGIQSNKVPSVSNTYSQTNGGLNRFNGALPQPQHGRQKVVSLSVKCKCGPRGDTFPFLAKQRNSRIKEQVRSCSHLFVTLNNQSMFTC